MNEGNEKSYSTETASDESDEVKISSQLESTSGNSSFGSRIGKFLHLRDHMTSFLGQRHLFEATSLLLQRHKQYQHCRYRHQAKLLEF